MEQFRTTLLLSILFHGKQRKIRCKERESRPLYVYKGNAKKYEHIAAAKIDYKRGVIICSTVDREK
jgi:hypothetical protein